MDDSEPAAPTGSAAPEASVPRLPPAPAAPEEPEVHFIPEEPFPEPVQFAAVDEGAKDATVEFGEPSPFEDYEVASFEELTPAETPQSPEALPVFEAIETGMEELLPISAEEAETLASAKKSAVETPSRPEAWSQPTVEVSLEERAQAGMEAAQMSPEPFFEEVFEEEPEALLPREEPPASELLVEQMLLERDEDALPALLDEPEPPPREFPPPAPLAFVVPAAAAAPAPVAAPAVAPVAIPHAAPPEAMQAPKEEAPAVAGVSVSPDMVTQVTERVVAQISERIVREVAWEVIPDLAEALIKKEIERLKAELAQT
jgi:hypothetical protein